MPDGSTHPEAALSPELRRILAEAAAEQRRDAQIADDIGWSDKRLGTFDLKSESGSEQFATLESLMIAVLNAGHDRNRAFEEGAGKGVDWYSSVQEAEQRRLAAALNLRRYRNRIEGEPPPKPTDIWLPHESPAVRCFELAAHEAADVRRHAITEHFGRIDAGLDAGLSNEEAVRRAIKHEAPGERERDFASSLKELVAREAHDAVLAALTGEPHKFSLPVGLIRERALWAAPIEDLGAVAKA